MAEIMCATMKKDNFYYVTLYQIGEKMPTLGAVIRTRVMTPEVRTRYKYVSRTVVKVDLIRRFAILKLNLKNGQKLDSKAWLLKSREVAE